MKRNKDKVDFLNVPIWDLLGIEIVEMKPGYANLNMKFDEKITQPYGMVHGGALFALADSAVAVAIYAMVEEGKRFLTIEMKINYLAPVVEGIIEARAKVLREGRIVPAEVDVYNEGKLVAKAIATYIIIDEHKSR